MPLSGERTGNAGSEQARTTKNGRGGACPSPAAIKGLSHSRSKLAFVHNRRRAGDTVFKGIDLIPDLERRIPMTTKELLYVDDALSHAQLLATQFQNAADQLQDNALRTQVSQMAQRHRQMYQQFYNLV